MDKTERKNYENAGKIWKLAAQHAKKQLKPQTTLLQIAQETERFVEHQLKEEQLDGGLAFPVNLSVNHVAAHATPKIADPAVLLESDLLKVDLGVQVQGYIADGAFSFNADNQWAKLIEANEFALEEALKTIEPESPIKKLGNRVHEIAEQHGFKPIENLTGHGLGKFTQHAAPTIPNVRNETTRRFTDNMAFAVEPFFSTGRGFVADGNQTEIFSLDELKPVREPNARTILEFVQKKFNKLPFAERQLASGLKLSEFSRKIGLRELSKNKILHPYPFLQEQKNAVVSQAEKTVLIDKEEVVIIN